MRLPLPVALLLLSCSCASPERPPEVTSSDKPVASSNAAPPTAAPTGAPEPASSVPPGASAKEAMSDVKTIEKNTQAQFGDDLRVGAGNIWEEEYTPQGGKPQRGLTAGLWIYVRDDKSKDQHVRVHPGQVVEVAGWRLEILSIDKQSVRVAAKKTAAP